MSQPHRPLGAQISHMLKDRGVEVIFGIPGVHNQEMYRGIEEAGLRHILARHEQGAGFMADGYARASGRPGVAYVITGPGLLNASTALGQAYSDSVPVLALSSCLDQTAAKRGQLHQMRDQRLAGEAVCDWSEEAGSAAEAYGLIDRAFAEFASKRPRSKHLQVPIRLLQSMAEAAPDVAALPARPVASKPQIKATAARITAARRPLFVFGGGAVASDCAGLLGRTGGAAFTTYAGRGTLPPGAPLSFGATLARSESAAVFASADLVIALGTALAEVDLWRDSLGQTCPMIRVDLDPENLVGTTPDDILINGDCHDFVARLIKELPAKTAVKWPATEIEKFRAKCRADLMAERSGIVEFADALKAALPSDTMIYSDMTQIAYVAKEVWDMDRPGHWHHPTGFGTLGYALPAAIGGAVARPGLPTVAIAGDYGFQYTVQELGTAVELGQSLPIILWDNGKLKEIEDSMIASQIAPNAVVARNPDFALLAQAYGCAYAAPKDLGSVAGHVSEALKVNRPTIIHVDHRIAL